MPININEFEVVVDAPKPPSGPGEQAQQQPPTRGATPREIEIILRREKERALRVRAH